MLATHLQNKNDRLEKFVLKCMRFALSRFHFCTFVRIVAFYYIIMTISEKSWNLTETRLLDWYTWSFPDYVFRWTTTVPSQNTWVARVSAVELLVNSNNNTSPIFTGNQSHVIHHMWTYKYKRQCAYFPNSCSYVQPFFVSLKWSSNFVILANLICYKYNHQYITIFQRCYNEM